MKKILKIMGATILIISSISTSLNFVRLNKINSVETLEKIMSSNDLLDNKVYLEEVLINTDLGVIELNKENENEILKLVEYNNPGIFINELTVKDANKKGVVFVRPKRNSIHYHQDFFGVLVNFNVMEKRSLESFVNINLPIIEDETIPSILLGIKSANPHLDLNQIDVIEESITNVSAIIKAKVDGIYQGEVLVKYSLEKKSLLKNDKIFPHKDLGFIPNNDLNQLKKSLWEKNPELEMGEIEIVVPKGWDDRFLVVPKGSKVYKFEIVVVSYKIPEFSLKNDILKGFYKDEQHKDNSKGYFSIGEIKNNRLLTIKNFFEDFGVQTSDLKIFNITNSNFKIQAIDNSKIYRLEEPLIIYFDLPIIKEDDLSKSIDEFSWIIKPEETKKQVLTRIYNKIYSKTGKTAVLGRDYQVIGIEHLKDYQKVGPRPNLSIKATPNSRYFSGKVSFSLRDKISLSELTNLNYETTWSVMKKVKNTGVEVNDPLDSLGIQLNNFLKISKIEDEELEINYNKFIKNSVEVLKEKSYYPPNIDAKTESEGIVGHYDTVGFKVTKESEYFIKNSVAKIRYQAPDYSFFDDYSFLNLNKTKFSTFISSDGDTNFPYMHSKYTNSNLRGVGSTWNNSKEAITLVSIDVKKIFNINNVDQFLKKYSFVILYSFFMNAWASGVGWAKQGGKSVQEAKWRLGAFEVAQHVPFGKKYANGLSLEQLPYQDFNDAEAFSFSLPSNGGHKKDYNIYGGVHGWIEKSNNNQILEVKAETANYFDEHNGFSLTSLVYFKPNLIMVVLNDDIDYNPDDY